MAPRVGAPRAELHVKYTRHLQQRLPCRFRYVGLKLMGIIIWTVSMLVEFTRNWRNKNYSNKCYFCS